MKRAPEGKLGPAERARRAIRAEMMTLGLNYARLASELGIGESYTLQLVNGHVTCRKGRARIEKFFGREFWEDSK